MLRKLMYFILAIFGVGAAIFWRFKEDESQKIQSPSCSPFMLKIRYMMSEMYYYFHANERPREDAIGLNFLQRMLQYVGL